MEEIPENGDSTLLAEKAEDIVPDESEESEPNHIESDSEGVITVATPTRKKDRMPKAVRFSVKSRLYFLWEYSTGRLFIVVEIALLLVICVQHSLGIVYGYYVSKYLHILQSSLICVWKGLGKIVFASTHAYTSVLWEKSLSEFLLWWKMTAYILEMWIK